MNDWTTAYLRQRASKNFRDYFGGGKVPPMSAFRAISYIQSFAVIGAGATSAATLQNFPQGAIILGVSVAGFMVQTVAGAFQYAPWSSEGRRDMITVNLQYTGDENLTPGGPGIAEALMGSGLETIYPGRELVIAPSQGILATVGNLGLNPLRADVVYHAMVIRAAA